MATTYICLSCSTEFKYKRQYNEHNLCCTFMKERVKERNNNLDLVDDRIPSDRMMYELVKNLALKCERLEKEVEDLILKIEYDEKYEIRNEDGIVVWLKKGKNESILFYNFEKQLVYFQTLNSQLLSKL